MILSYEQLKNIIIDKNQKMPFDELCPEAYLYSIDKNSEVFSGYIAYDASGDISFHKIYKNIRYNVEKDIIEYDMNSGSIIKSTWMPLNIGKIGYGNWLFFKDESIDEFIVEYKKSHKSEILMYLKNLIDHNKNWINEEENYVKKLKGNINAAESSINGMKQNIAKLQDKILAL